MAILDGLPGVAVFVTIAGKVITEHVDPHEKVDGSFAGNTVVKYIESISDSEFKIELKVSPPNRFDCATIKFRISIDGKPMSSKLCDLATLNKGNYTETVAGTTSTHPNGSRVLRKFKFSPIETVEDADSVRIKNDMIRFSQTGQIKVEVFRAGPVVKIGPKVPHSEFKDDSVLEVAEKAIKGKSLSHSTTFSPPIPCPSKNRVTVDMVDGRNKPIAVYIFKYLSKEALQQELIIPRTSSLDSYEGLPASEKERSASEMLAQLKASNAKEEVKSEKRVKRERDTDIGAQIIDLSGETSAGIGSIRPLKMVKMANGHAAIDLTD